MGAGDIVDSSGKIIGEVRRASRALVRELGLLGPHHPSQDCTAAEAHVIVELDQASSLRVGELSRRLVLDKSTVSRTLASLKRRLLISDRTAARDQRVKWFLLTDKGRKIASAIHSHADDQVGSALRHLRLEERGLLVTALDRYASALRKERLARDYAVRGLRREDVLPLLEVIRAVRAEFSAPDDLACMGSGSIALHEEYEASGAAYFVALRGNRIVGGAGIAPLRGGEQGTCELQRMYLLPDARGIGLGWRLLETCVESGRRMGHRACYLETMESMSHAIAFYERYGFRRLPRRLGATGHDHATAWFILDLRGDVEDP